MKTMELAALRCAIKRYEKYGYDYAVDYLLKWDAKMNRDCECVDFAMVMELLNTHVAMA